MSSDDWVILFLLMISPPVAIYTICRLLICGSSKGGGK